MEAMAKTDDEKVVLHVFQEIIKSGYGKLEITITQGKLDTIYLTESHKPGGKLYQKVLTNFGK